MVTFVKSIKLLVLFINACLFIIAKGDRELLSNYTNAKVSCHSRGGLITQKLLKFNGLFNITCELSVDNGVLKDGESVWIHGQAQIGPYIALHTCMRFRNQNRYSVSKNRTFYSNILYECSIFCFNNFHSYEYLGINKDSCFCLYDSYGVQKTPECLDNDFLDRHKGIIVFKQMRKQLFYIQSKSQNFNCLGASFQERGTTSYYNTKCSSSLYSMCMQRVDGDLSNKCQPRQEWFCLNKDHITFLEHYQKCWLYNGTLISFYAGRALHFSIMLGSFRAFKAIENVGQNNDIATWSCLSITKSNGIIYLETENCSNANGFVCMDDLFNKSGTETNDGASETNDVENTNIKQYFIITCSILVSAVILLILLVFWLLYRQHSHKRPRCNNGSSQNDMYLTPTPEERFENDATQLAESAAAYDEVK